MKFETHARVTIALGVLAGFAGAFNFLALNDIFHQEADLRLEWSIVRYTNFIFLLFLFSGISIAWRALQRERRLTPDTKSAQLQS